MTQYELDQDAMAALETAVFNNQTRLALEYVVVVLQNLELQLQELQAWETSIGRIQVEIEEIKQGLVVHVPAPEARLAKSRTTTKGSVKEATDAQSGT